MNYLKNLILESSADISDEIIRFRRHLHMNPELSFEEHQTANYICKFLDTNNIKYKKHIAGTGIVAIIEGNKKGKFNVGLRAEMDALPVKEANDVSYKSLNEGKMHACGHDAHMSMLMGTALLLNGMKDEFGGKFILIFQPGEELSPGGARLMIESGIFNEFKPDIVLAQHVLPELGTGFVGYKSGRYMASSDEIYISVRGKGGHAALPGLSTDQIYIASKLIVRLKDSVAEAREKNNIPTVLGIGKVRGDGATNVIPETVEIAGTFRTFDEGWRSEAKQMIRDISASVAAEYGVAVNVRIADGYPVLHNNEQLAEKAIRFSRELFGREKIELFDIRMSSEDFAFFTEAFPSLYFRVGIKGEGEAMKALHTPEFDIDEAGLKTGVANMTWLALRFINENLLP